MNRVWLQTGQASTGPLKGDPPASRPAQDAQDDGAEITSRHGSTDRKTMSSQKTSLLHTLHRATQVGSERLARALGRDGLTPRQYVVLQAIGERPGASQTVIGEATGIDRSTLGDLVQRLARLGLLTCQRTKFDARTYTIDLTDAGRAAVAKTTPVIQRIEHEMLAAIPAKARADFLAQLDRLAQRKPAIKQHLGPKVSDR